MGRTEPRIISNASEMDPVERYCTCCKQRLTKKVAWLELDQRTDRYHDCGGVPEDKSQGWFPFGMTCARNKLKDRAQPPAAQS